MGQFSGLGVGLVEQQAASPFTPPKCNSSPLKNGGRLEDRSILYHFIGLSAMIYMFVIFYHKVEGSSFWGISAYFLGQTRC